MAGKRKVKKVSRKEQKSQKRKDGVILNMTPSEIQAADDLQVAKSAAIVKDKKVLEISKIITVREFAEALNLPVTKVIGCLMNSGVMASINESIDFDTALIIGDELGYDIKLVGEQKKEKVELTDEQKSHLTPRSPVVVVMGHVDHGKTTLLDQIRKSDVVSTESGGITQHIGAYQVNWKDKEGNLRPITFLDTPGHEAFSSMRAHGANITDIAILVVAADDGVKPQTKEAVSHAKAANIPIIVAINKMDKPGADIEKVKRELANLELNPEEWGGNTVMVPVSAKLNQGIDELLDLLLVTADMADLKANPENTPQGVVIESHLQAGIGPVATVLVQDGTLKPGQIIVIGKTWGKIRRMENFQGKIIDIALPSTPVRIAGMQEVSDFGDIIELVDSEKDAKIRVQGRNLRQVKLGILELSEKIQSGEIEQLNIILKSDVQGSSEAIKTSLNNLSTDKVKIKIIHDGVGDITESDVNLAIASGALVIGFNSKPTIAAKNLANLREVKISTYSIIYELLDDISAALTGMLKPEIVEISLGKLEVLEVFHSTKDNKIVGGKVIDGKIVKGARAHHYHSGEKVNDGKITTLQTEKNPVTEVTKGFQCGLGLDITDTIKPGDIIEAYQLQENVVKKLE